MHKGKTCMENKDKHKCTRTFHISQRQTISYCTHTHTHKIPIAIAPGVFTFAIMRHVKFPHMTFETTRVYVTFAFASQNMRRTGILYCGGKCFSLLFFPC
jgi:hypothetical protein